MRYLGSSIQENREIYDYCSSYWSDMLTRQEHTHLEDKMKIRMLRWMCGHTKKDKIKNKVIQDKVGLISVVDYA